MPPILAIEQRLQEGTQTLGLDLTAVQKQRLLALLELLGQWNQAYNLTAVRDPVTMVGYLILDSLALLPYVQASPILDLGTGAGFPGLPLAIMLPEYNFTLLDSNGKKVRFVRQVVLDLGLDNVQLVQARIESYENAAAFAIVIARALAPLHQLLKWAAPLLQRPGVLLAPKGKDVQTELNSIASTCTEQILVHRIDVPQVIGQRVLVEVRFGEFK